MFAQVCDLRFCIIHWPSVSRQYARSSRSVVRRKAFQAVTKRLSQRLELLLKVSPVADAGRVERLPNLFGARRAHRALRLVEAKTGGLEAEPAVLEQAAHLSLRLAHQ